MRLSHTQRVHCQSCFSLSAGLLSMSVRLAGGVGINKGIEQSEVSETLA